MRISKKLGIIILLLLVILTILVFSWSKKDTKVATEPKWEDVYTTGSGITVSGTVISALGDEFLLDVMREDAPTLRAPSLYRIGEGTKIWQGNKWQKVKEVPKVGTMVMLYVPFSQEPAGIYIDTSYKYVSGKVGAWNNQIITIDKKNYDLKTAYVENKAKGQRENIWALLALEDGKVESAQIWPEELSKLANVISTARKSWLEEGFEAQDIDVVWQDGWYITGYQYPFKDRLNPAKLLFLSRDGSEVLAKKDFLPFDELEMRVAFAGKVYSNSWEQITMAELEKFTLLEAGEDYRGEKYYYLESSTKTVIYTKDNYDKSVLTVWKEVTENGDSPGGTFN